MVGSGLRTTESINLKWSDITENEITEEDEPEKSDSEEYENLSEGIESKANDSLSTDADADKLEKVKS